MCYSGLGFLLQQRAEKVVLPCSWEGLSLVISTACVLKLPTAAKNLLYPMKLVVVCGYPYAGGCRAEGDVWANENKSSSSLFTPLWAKHSWYSSVVWGICLRNVLFWWGQSLSLQFYFHNIAKILQQSWDTLEKCHFKENNMLGFISTSPN